MSDRPNIVRIDCHDAGQHVGPYGIDTVETPALDRLASEGVRVADSTCAAPQCSPSRASMATGRYPHSNGVLGLTNKGWDLNQDETHVAERLSAAGYTTALAGTRHESRRSDTFFDRAMQGSSVTDAAASEAAEYLNERAGEAAPFYLQVGFSDPHRRPRLPGTFMPPPDVDRAVDPLPATPEATVPPYLQDDPEARTSLAAFEGAVSRMDAMMGTVLEALDAADLVEETIVVATTDHGIPFPRAKCSLYEPGLETFLLYRWPGELPAGETYAGPVSTVDHLPTLLDLVDIDVPDSVQGLSHASQLRNAATDPASDREAVFAELTYHTYPDPRRSVRADGHKLIVNFTQSPFFMDPSQSWRPRTRPRHPERPALESHPVAELYDLEADPGETRNLIDDPAAADRREALLARLREWMASTGDPLLSGQLPTAPQHDAALDLLEGRVE